MIDLSYALYDKNGHYSQQVGTAMFSALKSTKEGVTIHLLHDDTLTDDNRQKFQQMVEKQCGQTIKFYNIQQLLPNRWAEIMGKDKLERFSPATFYRLLLAEVMPPDMDKILYLDGDTIPNLDIKELWDEPVADGEIGAVAENRTMDGDMILQKICLSGRVTRGDYLNSGVLSIHLDAFRKHPNLLTDGLKIFKFYPEFEYYDQDILNEFFSKTYTKLPQRYNVFTCKKLFDQAYYGEKSYPEHAIYHYINHGENLLGDDPFSRLFYKFYVQTPWFDGGESFVNAMREISTRCKYALLHLLQMLGSRKLKLVVSEDTRGSVESNFIGIDHECHVMKNERSIDELLALIDEVKSNRGKYLYLICTKNSYVIYYALQYKGLRPDMDFMFGNQFLPNSSESLVPGMGIFPNI